MSNEDPTVQQRPVWNPGPPRNSPIMRLFGGLLITVGALIAILTGACSTLGLLVAISVAISGGNSGLGSGAQMFGMIIVTGFLPCAVGVGLVLWGRRLRR